MATPKMIRLSSWAFAILKYLRLSLFPVKPRIFALLRWGQVWRGMAQSAGKFNEHLELWRWWIYPQFMVMLGGKMAISHQIRVSWYTKLELSFPCWFLSKRGVPWQLRDTKRREPAKKAECFSNGTLDFSEMVMFVRFKSTFLLLCRAALGGSSLLNHEKLMLKIV